jgi:uncharacterized protein YdhG (YjbR/CyaY superfamily)
LDDHPHQAYLDSLPPDQRAALEAVALVVADRFPDARPCIGYKIPAYRLGRIFFYFASFRHHVGIYPPVNTPPELVAELAPWRGPKGNLSFPHKQPLPLDLIGRVAEALAEQYRR